jgi:hypothetical protein
MDHKADRLDVAQEEVRMLRWRLSQTEEERDRYKRERDEFRNALINLLREASPYTPMSKHLLRECENAEAIVQELEGKT